MKDESSAREHPNRLLLLLIILSPIGAAAVLYGTHRGIGITPDSVLYLVVVALMAIVLFGQGSRLRKVVDFMLFALWSCSALAAWALRNPFVVGSVGGRGLFFHPITRDYLTIGAS